MKNLAFIELISLTNAKQLKALIDTISNEQLRALCEIALNYCEGNITASGSFSKRKDFLESLASTHIPLQTKREILQDSPIYRGIIQRLLRSIKLQ